jgi:hypothetical protein
MDDLGVRRIHRGRIIEEIHWDQLASVDIRTTSQGPFVDDVYWLLGSAMGQGVAVPSEAAPAGFVERLQQLPGFDNEAMIRAMASTDDMTFHCWPS